MQNIIIIHTPQTEPPWHSGMLLGLTTTCVGSASQHACQKHYKAPHLHPVALAPPIRCEITDKEGGLVGTRMAFMGNHCTVCVCAHLVFVSIQLYLVP